MNQAICMGLTGFRSARAFAMSLGRVALWGNCLLAASLAAIKKSVLLIDLDPQGNATMGSGIDKNNLSLSVYDVLVNSASIESVTLPSPSGNYQVIPANSDLTAAEVELLEIAKKEFCLRSALAQLVADGQITPIRFHDFAIYERADDAHGDEHGLIMEFHRL